MRVNEADETGKIPYSEVNRRAAYEAMRIQQNRNLKCQVVKGFPLPHLYIYINVPYLCSAREWHMS